MRTKTIKVKLNMSEVKKEYEKYHTSIDDLGEQIIATETQLIAEQAVSWGAAILGGEIATSFAGNFFIAWTAKSIMNNYLNEREAKKYAKILKALSHAGPSGYAKITLKVNYETTHIPYSNKPEVEIDTIRIYDWDCYSDGSVIG